MDALINFLSPDALEFVGRTAYQPRDSHRDALRLAIERPLQARIWTMPDVMNALFLARLVEYGAVSDHPLVRTVSGIAHAAPIRLRSALDWLTNEVLRGGPSEADPLPGPVQYSPKFLDLSPLSDVSDQRLRAMLCCRHPRSLFRRVERAVLPRARVATETQAAVAQSGLRRLAVPAQVRWVATARLCDSIESLSLEGLVGFDQTDAEHLASLPRLAVFRLECNAPPALGTFARSALHRVSLSGFASGQLSRVLGGAAVPSLRDLALSGRSGHVTPQVWGLIARAAPNLESLNMDGWESLTGEFIDELRGCPALARLSLVGTAFRTEDLGPVAQLPVLARLDISHTSVRSFRALYSALSAKESLLGVVHSCRVPVEGSFPRATGWVYKGAVEPSTIAERGPKPRRRIDGATFTGPL